MRWCAILCVLLALLITPACSSDPQLDKPTANPLADKYDRVEQQMQSVGVGADYPVVVMALGKPALFRQGDGFLVATWVGVHDWTLYFDMRTGQLVRKERS